MSEDNRTGTEILTDIAEEMRPEFDRIVAELGPDQVHANIMAGLRRMHDRALAEGRPSGAARAAAQFGINLDNP